MQPRIKKLTIKDIIMNKILYTILALIFTVTISNAQTATDFTCADCSSVNHNLFSELNSGKVIVLCWVMPCSNCINTALSTSNIVQTFHSSNPGRVFFYLCDDLANTPCATLNTWAVNNYIAYDAYFSNSVINMSDYTTSGMPKVVVLGGASHRVYYNADNVINATSLRDSITSALAATGIEEAVNGLSDLTITPNPAINNSKITFSLEKAATIKTELFNIEGKMIKNIFEGKLPQGENSLPLNLATLRAGIYFAKLTIGDKNKVVRLVVSE